jgi:hypothetical protein
MTDREKILNLMLSDDSDNQMLAFTLMQHCSPEDCRWIMYEFLPEIRKRYTDISRTRVGLWDIGTFSYSVCLHTLDFTFYFVYKSHFEYKGYWIEVRKRFTSSRVPKLYVEGPKIGWLDYHKKVLLNQILTLK